MTQLIITIRIDEEVGLTGRDIGKMIQRCTANTDQPLEVTATPNDIDIRFEKQYSEITLTGRLFERLDKAAKANHVSIETILTRGAERYGEKAK